jgi:hypothetical protein
VREVKIRYQGKVYTNSFNQDGIRVSGGGQVTVTVPGWYTYRMEGVCGTNSPKAGAHNFQLPSGEAADVEYGRGNWAMGGYGGRGSKMSKWHLAWRPSVDECMFSRAQCSSNVADLAAAKRQIVTKFGTVDVSATKPPRKPSVAKLLRRRRAAVKQAQRVMRMIEVQIKAMDAARVSLRMQRVRAAQQINGAQSIAEFNVAVAQLWGINRQVAKLQYARATLRVRKLKQVCCGGGNCYSCVD